MNRSRLVMFVVFVSLFIGLSVFYFYKQDSNSSNTVVKNNNIIESPDVASIDSTAPEDHLSSELALKLSLDNADNSLTDSVDSESVWQVSAEARDYYRSNPEQLASDVNAEEYVQIQPEKIAVMQAGDYMELLIPQLGVSYEAEVDKVTDHSNGDVTVEATFEGEDKAFGSIITVGEEETLGTLITPYGDYMLRAVGDKAWIASRSDLENTHDRNHVDGVVPQKNDVNDKTVRSTNQEKTNNEINIIN